MAYHYGAIADFSTEYTPQYVEAVLESVIQYLSNSGHVTGMWSTIKHHLSTAMHLLDMASGLCDIRMVAEQAKVHIGLILATLLCPWSQLDPLIIKQHHYNLLQLLVSQWH